MRRSPTRRLQFESLEKRQFLAGDVNVSVVAGQLFITGDHQVNDIELTSTGAAGQFTIKSGTFSATTINGGAGPLTIGGVTSHAFINLGDGNNQLIVNSNPAPISFAGNLRIEMAAGWDSLHVRGANNVSVAGAVEVISGEGVNVLYFERFHVGGHLTMTLGNSIDDVTLASGAVGGYVLINTGAQDDTVYMELAVSGSVFLNGTGEDELWIADMVTPTVIHGGLFVNMDNAALNLFKLDLRQDLVVHGGGSVRMGYSDIGGNSEIRLTGRHSTVNLAPIPGAPDVQQFGGDLLVEFGAAGGALTVEGANLAGDLVVSGGDGVESVNLTNVRVVSSLLIDVKGGNDAVRMQTASVLGQAMILGGAGGDYISLGVVRGNANFQIDAGAGYDLVNFAYSSIGGTVSVSAGSESDQVTLTVVGVKNLWLNAAAGFDAVKIEYSAFDTLYAQLGDANDSLTLRGSLVRIAALLDGGAGGDLFTGSGNLLKGLSRRNFEG
jgi:hypothetical protein